ncbi:MAG: DNA mismatch repair protein MutS [Vulcanimicrobiaceae bacterium]
MTAKFSPMLEQYFGMKAKHPEAILLSRVGDFYEAYGDDAETIARVLQIALTSKEAGAGRRVAMAGVPHHALPQYLAKLVSNRHVVALAEQLEVPVPNKLVHRDVMRVVTPGTLIEDQLLDGKENNYLAAVAMLGETFALAHGDVSTGYCAATAFAGDGAYDDLVAELGRVAPVEIVADLPSNVRAVLAGALDALGARMTAPTLSLVPTRTREQMDGFSLDESLAIHRALDALGAFVRKTGLADARVSAHPVDAFQEAYCYRHRHFLALDPNTRKHLELVKAQGQNLQATLLGTLDLCSTSMGSRLLARWIAMPLVDVGSIEARQDSLAALLAEHPRREALRAILRGCFDLERIAQKARLRRVSPRDLLSLRRTLEAMQSLPEAVPPPLEPLMERTRGFDDLLEDLRRTLVDDPPSGLGDGGVIRCEVDRELAECVLLRTDARGRLSELEERERLRTGIKTLKVKYARAFGYAIEVGKNSIDAVPADYVRKQTLTTGERFVTSELKELELAIATAQTRQQMIEGRLYGELVERIALRTDALLGAAQALAQIDVLVALAQAAAERGYVRPTFVPESTIEVIDGRHPVMEAVLHAHFVPNDARLLAKEHRFILLTGPNMGGKSTYLRQIGLLVIMAQMGSFVPARDMRLGIVDRIFTRIGAGDDLASGQSTFYMEMAEAAHILRRSTRRSLLLIDEVGRGTGTLDGLAIAQAMCEFLLGLGEQSPMALFATHFHELCALGDHWAGVSNYHITAVENRARDGAPVFSHRVQPGSSSRSFGIEVARMAGMPEAVIERAQEIADALAPRSDVEAQVPLRKAMMRVTTSAQQLSFLTGDS